MEKKAKKKPFWQDRRYVPYLFIAPNMILFLGFMIIPLFMSFYYSTVKWNGLGDPKFIGLENYVYIFTKDRVFLKSLGNTFLFSAMTVPVIMILALFFAILLNEKFPLRGFARSAIYLPAVVSTVAAGAVFNWLFQDQIGIINYLLSLVGVEAIKWTADPRYAMIMVAVASIWQRTGYNMVIYLAGLQGISTEVMEAAAIDGCNGWQKFWHITFPLLKSTHVFIFITCMINAFRSFDLVYTMTKGGPLNSTKTLVMYVYEQAFSKNSFGRASAAGVILFLILFIFTIVRNRAEKED